MTITAPTDESLLVRWTNPERAFVVLALLFGTALVLIIPPFQSADEPFHFLRAFQITDGVFVSHQVDARGVATGDFPVSLYKIWLPFSHIGFHPEVKASARDIRGALRIPLDKNERMLITIASTAHYSPVCYLPQSFGILIGRAVGAEPLVLLYLGREANLLAWILLGYLALRSAPAISRPMFLLLLMPMSLYLAATNSADVPTNAVALLFTATVCRFAGFDKANSIGAERFLILLLLSMAVCLCKFGYAPLLFLILMIPSRNFGSRTQYVVKLASLVVFCAAVLIAWIAVSSNIDTRINMSPDVSAPDQLAWLMHHPFHFIPLLLETFRQRAWTYAQSFVGLIGWLDLYVPTPLVICYLVLLTLACLVYENKSPLPPPLRAAVVVLPAVICSFLIMALLSYMYWTPVRASFIDGIHGRYLIPLAPAVFILICSLTRQAHWRLPFSSRTTDVALPLISICICIYFVGLVWMRYYG